MTTNFKIPYRFSSRVWQYAGPGGWYFVSLPQRLSREIRASFRSEEGGWGRLTATARIGNSEWRSAIWYDSRKKTYLLPLKAEIRKNEKLVAGKRVNAVVFI
ncbi:MAG: DUF1905 domain-containing protein [Bacteroidota bacterium]